MDLTSLKISAPLGFAAVLFSWCVALAAPTAPAVYTNAQAAQGGSVYASQCASCHGGQLEGNIGPAMKGPQFKQMVAAQQLTGASLLAVDFEVHAKINTWFADCHGICEHCGLHPAAERIAGGTNATRAE